MKTSKKINEKVGRLDKRITIITTNDVSEDGWNNSEETVFHKCWAQLVDIRTRDYNLQFKLVPKIKSISGLDLKKVSQLI